MFQTNGRTMQPEERRLIQRMFDDFCAARGIEHDALAATDTASFLISAYQSGVRDEERLRRVIGLGLASPDGRPEARPSERT
jgi:hypothetical protein